MNGGLRCAGRTPWPILTPITAPLFASARNLGLVRFAPFELDYLRFPWLVDTSRMREEMGFQPRWHGGDALASQAHAMKSPGFDAGSDEE